MRRTISVLFLSPHTTILLKGSGYFSQVSMSARRMISSLSTELFSGTLLLSVITYEAFFSSLSRRRPFPCSTSGRGRSRYRLCVGPWEKGQTARYRRRIEREQFVPEPELGLVHVSRIARCPEFAQKVPEKTLKEFTWAVFVGIRESRFVRVPVYTRMHELSVATL